MKNLALINSIANIAKTETGFAFTEIANFAEPISRELPKEALNAYHLFFISEPLKAARAMQHCIEQNIPLSRKNYKQPSNLTTERAITFDTCATFADFIAPLTEEQKSHLYTACDELAEIQTKGKNLATMLLNDGTYKAGQFLNCSGFLGMIIRAELNSPIYIFYGNSDIETAFTNDTIQLIEASELTEKEIEFLNPADLESRTEKYEAKAADKLTKAAKRKEERQERQAKADEATKEREIKKAIKAYAKALKAAYTAAIKAAYATEAEAEAAATADTEAAATATAAKAAAEAAGATAEALQATEAEAAEAAAEAERAAEDKATKAAEATAAKQAKQAHKEAKEATKQAAKEAKQATEAEAAAEAAAKAAESKEAKQDAGKALRAAKAASKAAAAKLEKAEAAEAAAKEAAEATKAAQK